MPSARAVAWLERLVWILVYAGLLAIVLGIATLSASAVAGWPLITAGGVLAVAGVVLIWVRSRIKPPGSNNPKER
jgi:hypothetical protein